MNKKNIGKIIIGGASLFAACGIAYYFVKDYINKKVLNNDSLDEDFEDFDDLDDFEDLDDLDEDDEKINDQFNSREYVTLNITSPEESENSTVIEDTKEDEILKDSTKDNTTAK